VLTTKGDGPRWEDYGVDVDGVGNTIVCGMGTTIVCGVGTTVGCGMGIIGECGVGTTKGDGDQMDVDVVVATIVCGVGTLAGDGALMGALRVICQGTLWYTMWSTSYLTKQNI